MPVHNEDIARLFDEMADLLEIEDANPFRVRAYRNAARTVRGLTNELAKMVAEGADLTRLAGIGKELSAKIREILATGTMRALVEVHQEVPATLEELLRIPGLGPKRVHKLYHELQILNLPDLEKAARDGRIAALPGFGRRTVDRILANISAHRDKKRRYPRFVAIPYAESLATYVKSTSGVTKVMLAGSYRRGLETVGDLDILVTTDTPGTVMKRFTEYDEVDEILARGDTKASVILRCGLQVDLRIVPSASFGAALHYFTGSKNHNIQMRRLAQSQGLKINEYGVFRGQRRLAGATESSVFDALGLHFIPAELREGGGEIEAARAGQLPRPLTLADLRGDLHVHTTASDGRADLKTMVRAARKSGLSYLAITDHSRRLGYAHGLDSARLERQIDSIDRLNESIRGIRILKGIEVDILANGSLDLPNNILAKLDLVIGAVHTRFGLSRTKQTARILRALDNRYFSILAHPSGRMIEEREAYDVDMPRIIKKAADRGCFLELNSQPKRLDLTADYCRLARDEGVLIAIDSDSHDEKGFDNLGFGVTQAARGWLEKADVLNTRSLRDLRPLLKRTMG